MHKRPTQGSGEVSLPELLLNVIFLDGGFSSRGQGTYLLALISGQMASLQDAAAEAKSIYEFRFLR